MQHYISTCKQCNNEISWLGPNTFIVKTVYPICEICSYQTCEQDKKINETQTQEYLNKLFAASECQHNWVLDGHNAGDPICSKCFSR